MHTNSIMKELKGNLVTIFFHMLNNNSAKHTQNYSNECNSYAWNKLEIFHKKLLCLLVIIRAKA